MTNYINHIIINFALVLILLFFYQQNTFLSNTQLGIFIITYFIGTVFLTPDIDTRSEPSRRCGVLFKPYTIMSHHRGQTHKWYGSFFIILYILIILSLIIIIFDPSYLFPFYNTLLTYKNEIVYAVIGIFLSNFFHIVTDFLS